MLAGLRMILAHQGINLTETALLQDVNLQEGGVDP